MTTFASVADAGCVTASVCCTGAGTGAVTGTGLANADAGGVATSIHVTSTLTGLTNSPACCSFFIIVLAGIRVNIIL